MSASLRSDRGVGLPVVYVPGIDGTGALLLGLEERIERNKRLLTIRYDMSPEPTPGSYEELAASVAEVIRRAGVERCLILAESFGGAVALRLAADHPEIVGGLMIINSFAYFPERINIEFALRMTQVMPNPIFHFARLWIAPMRLFGQRRDPQALLDFRALKGSEFDAGYCRRMKMIKNLDMRSRLALVKQPTALYAGDADKIVSSVGCLSDIKRVLSDATLEIIPGGGHLILPLAAEPWVERIDALALRAGF
ncbi:MAG: alpha/beta hydrolase [bacterium]